MTMMVMIMQMMMMAMKVKKMMMMKEITSRFVLWGRGVRPNFLGAECVTDDCTGKQPDHYFDDDFDFDYHHFVFILNDLH